MSSTALVVSEFHKLFYGSGQWVENTLWMGVPAQKCPLDLWVYQELLYELRPELIIETGTCFGGSALFFAHMCDLLGKGQVVTVDIAPRPDRPKHSRIEYFTGSSVDPYIISAFTQVARSAKNVLVVLDSDHSRDYVLREMQAYAQFVTPNSYMIVEDTDLNGHPIMPDHGPGPAEAVTEFLLTHPEFEVDASREKFMLTQNPGGYLKRKPA
jgi:cephalosporin hydroxylase